MSHRLLEVIAPPEEAAAVESALRESSLLSLASNVLCVHLAAVGTFAAQGVKPSKWWESEKARRASRYSLTLCAVLLVGLVGLLMVRAYVLGG